MARGTAEERQDQKLMSVWDHLRELRGRITISLIAVAFGAIICFALFEPILGFILDHTRTSPTRSSSPPARSTPSSCV